MSSNTFHAIFFNLRSNISPGVRSLGCHRIATWLRQHNWDVEVIDFFQDWSFEELQELLKSRVTDNTKFFGFSRMFFNDEEKISEIFLHYLKKVYPNKKILIGGPEKYPYNVRFVDAIISGYSEYAILEILKYYFSDGKRPKYSLLSPVGKHIDANKMYPAYPMKSLMVRYEDRDFIHPYEWLGIEISRGCMFQCDFCNYPILGVKGDYSRDGEDFRSQLQDTYDRFGTDKYLISDETFNDRTEKITKFANEVEKLNFDPFFWAFIRADLLAIRKKDREELLRMNVLSHFYGVETFNSKSGKAIKKGMDPEKLKNGLLDIKNFFMNNGSKKYRGTISLIIGLPYESKESIEETKFWLIKNWQTQSFAHGAFRLYDYPGATESLIMKNKELYGYKKMKDGSTTHASSKQSSLIWENDEMNFYEAQQLSEELTRIRFSDEYDFRIPSWFMSNIYSKHPNFDKKDCDIEDIVNFQNLTQKYKNQKLSL